MGLGGGGGLPQIPLRKNSAKEQLFLAKNASFSLFWPTFLRNFHILAITQQMMIKAMNEASWSNNDEVKDLKNTSAEIDIKVAHFLEAKKFTETKE